MKFTATTTKQLALPKGTKELIVFDPDLAGFGLRLRKSGARSWIVQFKVGKQHRRMTLGSTALLDFTKARSTARDVLARVRMGEDPQAQKVHARVMAGETFGRYLDAYLAWKEPQVRPNSFREITRHLQTYGKPWHTRPLSSLTQRDAADLIDTITTKHGGASANRSKASFGPYFTWLMGKGRVDSNPFAFVPKASENDSRARVLTDAELAAVWHAAADAGQFGVIVRLLMLTAARRAEIGDLRWSEYAGGMITVPETRSKNRRALEVIPSTWAREILESQPRRNSTDFVFGQRDGAGFSGWSKAKRELDERLAANGVIMAPWTLHDLRRTVATGLAERLQVEPHVIEVVLNHVGFRAGVHGVYNRSLYRAEKAAAWQRWSDHVQALIIDHQANEPKRLTAPARSTPAKDRTHGQRFQEVEKA